MKGPLLSIQELAIQFGGLRVIDGLSFDVMSSSITGIIGPNGAGKTTIFNCITGFYKPTRGKLLLSHSNQVFSLGEMGDFRISSEARVVRTFQNIQLFSNLSLLENLLVAQHNPLMHASFFSIGGIFYSKRYLNAEKQAIEKARFWLDRIRLLEFADRPASTLPYGAQRRFEIARAMCTDPVLLCLDEPAAGLNSRESLELNDLLCDIRKKDGVSLLLIEHDMSVVMKICDHVIVIDYGKKIAQGAPLAIQNDQRVIAAYLGIEPEG